jgi:hypothetical protein
MDFQAYKRKASRNIEIGDHLLTVTYPLLKDSKLLLGVLENIFLALTNSMSSVLYYELEFKRIPPFKDEFDSKYSVFARRVVPRYRTRKETLELLQEVKDLVMKHKKSPVEFVRKDKYIICDENYGFDALDTALLRKYLEETKRFYRDIDEITSKHENLFKRRTLR